MARSRAVVERAFARGDPIYGTTTGLGAHKRHRVTDPVAFNRELIANHRGGHGPQASPDVVRAAMLRLVNGFAKGTVGVRPLLAERLVDALNRGAHPPRPPARLGRHGRPRPARRPRRRRLRRCRARRRRRHSRSSTTTPSRPAWAALAIADLARVARLAVGRRGARPRGVRREPDDPRPARCGGPPIRRDPHRAGNASRACSTGAISGRPAPRATSRTRSRSARSSRCTAPRATRSPSRRGQLAVELNAHHDNPLVVTGEDRIVSAGCYDVLPVAAALDFLRIALAPVLTAAVERSLKLLQAPLSGLPGGLSAEEGLDARRARGDLVVGDGADRRGAPAGAAGVVRARQRRPRRRGSAIGSRWPRWRRAGSPSRWRSESGSLRSASSARRRRSTSGGRPRSGALTGAVRALVRERVPFAGPGVPYPTDLEPLVELVRSGALAG